MMNTEIFENVYAELFVFSVQDPFCATSKKTLHVERKPQEKSLNIETRMLRVVFN